MASGWQNKPDRKDGLVCAGGCTLPSTTNFTTVPSHSNHTTGIHCWHPHRQSTPSSSSPPLPCHRIIQRQSRRILSVQPTIWIVITCHTSTETFSKATASAANPRAGRSYARLTTGGTQIKKHGAVSILSRPMTFTKWRRSSGSMASRLVP